jgi:hypothetical protein
MWGGGITEHIPMLREDSASENSTRLRVRILLIRPSSTALRMLTFRAIEPPAGDRVEAEAHRYAEQLNRRAQNIEDQLRANLNTLRGIAEENPERT